eukprot:398006_1
MYLFFHPPVSQPTQHTTAHRLSRVPLSLSPTHTHTHTNSFDPTYEIFNEVDFSVNANQPEAMRLADQTKVPIMHCSPPTMPGMHQFNCFMRFIIIVSYRSKDQCGRRYYFLYVNFYTKISRLSGHC